MKPMCRGCDDASWAELDQFVQEYEAAYARDGCAELARFLPPRGHALFAKVLRELIRVDLEYGWGRGRPNGLDWYLDRFPDLVDDPRGWREIVFEEFRLRLQYGATEPPDVASYRARYGDEIADELSYWQQFLEPLGTRERRPLPRLRRSGAIDT
jgi:hypothetical protein